MSAKTRKDQTDDWPIQGKNSEDKRIYKYCVTVKTASCIIDYSRRTIIFTLDTSKTV